MPEDHQDGLFTMDTMTQNTPETWNASKTPQLSFSGFRRKMAEKEKQYNYSCTNLKGMWLSISSRQQRLITKLSWFLWEQKKKKEKKTSKNISWQSVVITMESWWTIKDTINHLRHTVSSMQLWTGSYLCSDFPFGWASIGELVWRESRDIMWREPSTWILSPVPAAVMTAAHSLCRPAMCVYVCVHACTCESW